MLKQYHEQRFAELEKIYAENPLKVVELYCNVMNFDLALKDTESYQDKYIELLPRITFIRQYYEYRFARFSVESAKSL